MPNQINQKWLKIPLSLAIILTLLGVYFLSPFNELLGASEFFAMTEQFPDSWPVSGAFLFIFAISGIVFLPMPLIALTAGLIFPPMQAFILSMVGVALASMTGFVVGRLLKREILSREVDGQLSGIIEGIKAKDAYAIALMRVAPTPPFTITSLIAGALNINFSKYIAASVIGIAPLILASAVFGKSILQALANPSSITFATILIGFGLYGMFQAWRTSLKES